jgi:membrane fusion protein (multidrug efflux system)
VTIELEVVADEHADGLRPGMSARVHLPLESRTGTVVIPAEYVIRDGEQRFVFILDERPRPATGPPAGATAEPAGPWARRVPVQLGLRSGEQVEVVKGLQPGDPLIVRGQHQLTDGVRVEVVPAPPPATPAAALRPLASPSP